MFLFHCSNNLYDIPGGNSLHNIAMVDNGSFPQDGNRTKNFAHVLNDSIIDSQIHIRQIAILGNAHERDMELNIQIDKFPHVAPCQGLFRHIHKLFQLFDIVGIYVGGRVGEWDLVTPVATALMLFQALTGSKERRLEVLPESTHFMLHEKNRIMLLTRMQHFLEGGKLESR